MELLNLQISVWAFAKAFYIIAIVIYIVFSLVVVRQVQMMADTLKVTFGEAVKIAAWLHLIFAIGVMFLAISIL